MNVTNLEQIPLESLLNENMVNGHVVSLCVVVSILFWTDWDASLPRIEAASMSGEGRRTIHRETGSGGWPNGLTVDYMERRIVWIDARYTTAPTHPDTPSLTYSLSSPFMSMYPFVSRSLSHTCTRSPSHHFALILQPASVIFILYLSSWLPQVYFN